MRKYMPWRYGKVRNGRQRGRKEQRRVRSQKQIIQSRQFLGKDGR